MFMNPSTQFCSDVLLPRLVYNFSAMPIKISISVFAGRYDNVFGYANE